MTAAGFRLRKVKLEQSIGDTLKKARTKKKLCIADAEEATKIRGRFLLALESDSWDQIPSEVYGRGYLETYAQFLQLPTEKLMEQFDRSRATYLRSNCDQTIELAPVSRVNTRSFQLTPRAFVISLTVLVALVFAGMIGYQINRYAAPPFLQLATPAMAREIGVSGLEINADSFNLTGKTVTGATVKVNGQPVLVMADGSFSQSVAVQKGVNSVVVEATNTSGKTASETLTVVVK